jgi:hypothetical protein
MGAVGRATARRPTGEITDGLVQIRECRRMSCGTAETYRV